MKRIKALFTIKTKFEAFLAIYALALGACQRGFLYIEQYPGFGGKLLFAACISAVFIAGGLMIDAVTLKQTYQS